MSEQQILREIEEDVRRQRLEELWQAWGVYIVGAAVALVAAVAGYMIWENVSRAAREEASIAYLAALDLADANTPGAGDALAAVAAGSPTGYATLARLSEAGVRGKTDREAAVKIYDEIANGGDALLGGLARYKAALLVADTASLDEMKSRLAAITADDSPWRYNARELLAYARFRAKDYEGARAELERLLSDLLLPNGVRNRAQRLLAQLGKLAPAPEPAPPAETAPEAEPAPEAPMPAGDPPS